LIRSMYPDGVVLTSAGFDYETGLHETILHKSAH